jgi:hypothetical protein
MTADNAPRAANGEQRRPDLILGIIDNCTYFEVSPFILTLRKTAFDGHVCLFAGENISIATAAMLRRLGVEVIRYKEKFPFTPDPHPDNFKWLPEPIYIYNYRHFLYLDYLLKRPRRFRNVLITDVRDVAFQRNPFDFEIEDAIHVAMESSKIPIGDCPWNSGWIVTGFGEAALDAVRNSEMSCAGTTLAPSPRMERYLRTILSTIQRMADAYECADQAAHNLLLHEGKLEPSVRMYNFRSPFLTVGTETAYRLDPSGRLVNEDGSLIHLVHQYDRHSELVRLFEGKARPSPWRRILAKLFNRIERRVQRLFRTTDRSREGADKDAPARASEVPA